VHRVHRTYQDTLLGRAEGPSVSPENRGGYGGKELKDPQTHSQTKKSKSWRGCKTASLRIITGNQEKKKDERERLRNSIEKRGTANTEGASPHGRCNKNQKKTLGRSRILLSSCMQREWEGDCPGSGMNQANQESRRVAARPARFGGEKGERRLYPSSTGRRILKFSQGAIRPSETPVRVAGIGGGGL